MNQLDLKVVDAAKNVWKLFFVVFKIEKKLSSFKSSERINEKTRFRLLKPLH